MQLKFDVGEVMALKLLRVTVPFVAIVRFTACGGAAFTRVGGSNTVNATGSTAPKV
jgi:hypothetical protein